MPSSDSKKSKKKKEFTSKEMELELINTIDNDQKRKQEDHLQSKDAKKSKSSKYEYIQSEELNQVSNEIVSAFLKKEEITIQPMDANLKPILAFDQVHFPKRISKFLNNFEKPTSIQSVSWPPILSGKDLIGIAATGSGKTLAFGIPAFLRLYKKESTCPKVLVLSPTRELAMQIQDQFEKLGEKTNVNSVCIYGGVSKQDQKKALRAGVSVIVATPGRLMDLVQEDKNVCNLSQIEYLVLDEADRFEFLNCLTF